MKDVNELVLPKTFYKSGVAIGKDKLPDEIASFFKEKISTLENSVELNDSVYNGTQKVPSVTKMFMTWHLWQNASGL